MEKIIVAIYDLLGEEKRKGENDPKQSMNCKLNQLFQSLKPF